MSQIARRWLVRGLCAGVVAMVTLAVPARAQQKLKPLHIALANHSVSMTAIYVAKHLGIFEHHGFDPRVMVLEPRAALAAMLAGELDFYTAIGSTARAALRGVPVRVETVKLLKQGFHILARAADEVELPQSGLGMSVATMQSKREFLRPGMQAVLEAIRIIANQREKVVPVLVKQLSLTQEEAGYVYDAMRGGWALDGKPTAAAMKLDAELSMRDMGLKELPKPEQPYDFSLLDEVAKR